MSIRIILVDDHALVREGIARLLDGQPDMRVIASFGAGREAIRYAEREEADVAVLDVAMPDLNGIEVARSLQDVSPGTRIVMLSMHADVEYVHRALLAGAQGYVLKDCAGRVLLEAVRSVHGGRRYVCGQITPQELDQHFRGRVWRLLVENRPAGPRAAVALALDQRSARSAECPRARSAAAHGRRQDD